METILQRLRENIDKLGEKAAKEIEEKFVGKGVVILCTVRGEKSTIKDYVICFPNKVYPETLAMQSDTKYIVQILSKEDKKFVSYAKLTCKEEYDRTHYNDNIQFLDENKIEEVGNEILAIIQKQKVFFHSQPSNGDVYYKISNHQGVWEGEKKIQLNDYVEQLKKELKEYMNGSI